VVLRFHSICKNDDWVIESFRIHVVQERSRIFIPEGDYHPCNYSVESDWSAAAFWYEAAALADHVDLELQGLSRESLQGDSVISEIFRLLTSLRNSPEKEFT